MTGLPMVVADSGLPARVTIYEVGPRDGLQNEKTIVSTAVKVEFINRLIAAGLPIVEATSFVHPAWVPQLADAAEVMRMLGGLDELDQRVSTGSTNGGLDEFDQRVSTGSTNGGLDQRVSTGSTNGGLDQRKLRVLVPNARGLDRALEAGCKHIAIFASATQTFAQKNLNSTLDDQYAMFEPVASRALAAGVDVRAYLSMCFGDPWEGAVPAAQVVTAGKRLLDMGASQLSIGDTIGVATAAQVSALIDAFAAAGVGTDLLAMHFHDTYGQALANAYAALQKGITTFDASAGGLGGCPYAKSATGNLATEDLVWMLTGLGIEHGVDLDALVATSVWMAGHLGRPSPSAVVRALGSPTP